ncbi:MAG: CaiB/BaiF CoA-transferase family protein, partial [Actinomycetota bacterium]
SPLACTMLADMGCDVIRIERLSPSGNALGDQLGDIGVRSRTTIAVDMKDAEGQSVVRSIVDRADILIEAFRPGTAERLGVGPERFVESNPGLVYVRLTGWGQDGPYSMMAGHDINYIGLTGALEAIGERDRPLPPLNLVGDYAGGSMFAIVRALAALVERSRTGKGAVVDVAMIDGVDSLMTPIKDLADLGVWTERRSSNLLDGGAPFYCTYRTADGGFMAVGALEPAFYSSFVAGLGLAEEDLPNRFDPSNWSDLEITFADAFAEEDREHWTRVFDGTDACVTPVLSLSEAQDHPQNRARDNSLAGAHRVEALEAVLEDAGMAREDIDALVAAGVVASR